LIRLSKLHEGQIWNTSGEIRPFDPGMTLALNVSVGLAEPGLWTVEADVMQGAEVVSTWRRDVSVSPTTDVWQEWRSELSLPNKTHLLLAFYYPWYGTPRGPGGIWMHWVPEREYDTTHVPLIGFYDSRSEDVVRYHVRIAQSVGFDGFISSWWGTGNYIDEAFSKLLDVAAAAGFKATIYLEVAQNPTELHDELYYILSKYGGHPAFLKWEGRPVIFIYGRVMGSIGLDDFAEVFSELRDDGFPAFYMADRLDTKYLQVFDGLHTYSPLSAAGQYPELSSACKERGKIFAATISPGYDDRIIRRPGMFVDRANGSFYRDMWERVMLSKPDWVLVTSFNEWHEGTEIEPSLEFGDLYLNLTEGYYRLFEEGKLTPRWEERVREVVSMFSQAQALIDDAERKGIDTRIMRRDYSIAQKSWRNYDYEVTKMYLVRVLARSQDIPESLTLSLPLLVMLLAGIPWARSRQWSADTPWSRRHADGSPPG